MSKLSLQVNLNCYADANPTNAPALSAFRWNRQGVLDVTEPQSVQSVLGPQESRSLFTGDVALSHTSSTVYDLTLKVGSANTYQLKHVSGPAPVFRAARTTGADATTEITLTKNANLMTLTSSAGTPLSLIVGGVTVGDQIKLGEVFDAANQGVFPILSVTATTLTFSNPNGSPEADVLLDTDFADVLRAFGTAGVKAGDRLQITGGFSPASYGSYEVTYAQDDYVEFYNTMAIPEQTGVQTNQLSIYSDAKRLVYIETNLPVRLTINGTDMGLIEPVYNVGNQFVGMILISKTVFSLSVQNPGTVPATVTMLSVE